MLNARRQCTPLTRRCRKALWNMDRDGNRIMPSCCTRHLKETIFYLADLFEKNGVKYWLDFGTLLGAVREGRTIPWDYDADFGVLNSQRKLIEGLRNTIVDDGFGWECWRKTKDSGLIRICRSPINHTWVDLFLWKNAGHGLLRSDFYLNYPKQFPRYFIQRLEEVELSGKMLKAPRDIELFLDMRFGTDWRVPQDKKVHGNPAKAAHAVVIKKVRAMQERKKKGLPPQHVERRAKFL
tara:strand:+ start:639 stop:1352 length:714 start_codon:yes stop_codon:yes gene_type:complete